MKTAMQKAIEHYESLSAQGSNQAYVIAKFLKEKFLEEEKEQIKNAFYEGMKSQPFDPNLGRAELYYKATYNSLDLKAMEQKLDNALTQETTESLTEWLNNKRMTKEDAKAYVAQYNNEEELRKEGAIDFSKWLAKEWMSIWVEDKWLWENVEVNTNDKSKWIGYYTEEQLWEIYKKETE